MKARYIGILLLCCVLVGIGTGYVVGPEFRHDRSSPGPDLESPFEELLARLNQIEMRMDRLIVTVDGLSNTLYETQTHADNSFDAQGQYEHDTGREAANQIVKRQEYEDNNPVDDGIGYRAVENRIYESLTNQTIDLPALLASEDMNSLPVERQEHVMNEITRRINSGDIDKGQFLPGYSRYQ